MIKKKLSIYRNNSIEYIVACQAHPALVKIGLVLARIFHFNSLLVCIRLVKVLHTSCVCHNRLVVHPPWLDSGLVTSVRTKGLTAHVSSRHGAKTVLRRPRPTGM